MFHCALAPVTQEAAREMIAELKAVKLLTGYRGEPEADITALAETVAAISRFAADNEGVLASVEINPLVVLPKGQGAVALDAVIERKHVRHEAARRLQSMVAKLPPRSVSDSGGTPSGVQGAAHLAPSSPCSGVRMTRVALVQHGDSRCNF